MEDDNRHFPPKKPQNNTSFTRNVNLPLLQSKTEKKKKTPACSYLFLLLTRQLHLLPLLFHLRGGELLLFVVRGQELLAQADQLGDHGGELVLLFRQALRSTCKEEAGGGSGEEERKKGLAPGWCLQEKKRFLAGT